MPLDRSSRKASIKAKEKLSQRTKANDDKSMIQSKSYSSVRKITKKRPSLHDGQKTKKITKKKKKQKLSDELDDSIIYEDSVQNENSLKIVNISSHLNKSDSGLGELEEDEHHMINENENKKEKKTLKRKRKSQVKGEIGEPDLNKKERISNIPKTILNDIPDLCAELINQTNHGDETSDESDSEWEEVHEEITPQEIVKPKTAIQISIKQPTKNIKKKYLSKQIFFKKIYNRYKRETQLIMHKVHLICLTMYGRHLNKKVCLDDTLSAILYSTLSNDICNKKLDDWTLDSISDFVEWLTREYIEDKELKDNNAREMLDSLQPVHMRHSADLNLFAISLLRSMGFKVRLVYSLRLLSHKSSDLKILKETTWENVEVKVSYMNEKNKEKHNISRSLYDEIDLSDVKVDSVSGIKSQIWLELFLPKLKKWICIECITGIIGKPLEITLHMNYPFSYVIAFDNANKIADVTERYAIDWLEKTRKMRVASKCWMELMAPYLIDEDEMESDFKEFRDKISSAPLPKTISKFKNHPLYVLKRHLLKFEAIYPENCKPISTLNGEDIFSRYHVYELHAKEVWLKQGLSVKDGELPYKMVKARPKRGKKAILIDGNEPMTGVFGKWQTEIYVSPSAVDGKVPVNRFGNVELFSESMLPPGTTHVKDVENIAKAAKDLKIDCIPAVVGWDFHGGFSHVVLEGYVVCDEHVDLLTSAAREWTVRFKTLEIEKREKKVVARWRSLMRRFFIKIRVSKLYDKSEKSTQDRNAFLEEHTETM